MHALSLLLLLSQDLPESAVRRLEGHTDGVRAVAWSPNGRWIASASRDGTAAIWDAGTGTRARVLVGHRGGATCLAWSPDGRRLLTGSQDRTIALWEAATGLRVKSLEGSEGWIKSVAFAPDGRSALSAALDRSVSVWDIETGRKERSFQAHPMRVLSADFSTDGRWVLTGNEDQATWLWSLDDAAQRRMLPAHQWWNRAVALSPDVRTAAAASWDKTISILDVASGALLKVLKGHDGWAWSLGFSPDGRLLGSAGQDGTVGIWELSTGRLLCRLSGHRGQAYALAWSPGGRLAASGAEEGAVLVWNPQAKETRAAAAWFEEWGAKPEEERAKDLEELVGRLGAPGWPEFAAARERLIQIGGPAAQAILKAHPPLPRPAAPGEDRLKKLLAEMDSDEFEVRVRARKELFGFGRQVLPWIEKTLREGADLSAEVRGGLTEIRARLRDPAETRDVPARIQAVLVLIEMTASEATVAALGRYSEGPEESEVTRLARRASGR